MSTLMMPSHDHTAFDTLCEPLEEFDHLPAVKAEAPESEHDPQPDTEEAPLDGLILAGLVAPY